MEVDQLLEAGGSLGMRIQRALREALEYDCSVGVAENKVGAFGSPSRPPACLRWFFDVRNPFNAIRVANTLSEFELSIASTCELQNCR